MKLFITLLLAGILISWSISIMHTIGKDISSYSDFDFWEERWKNKFLKVFDIVIFSLFGIIVLVILAAYLAKAMNYYILFYETY